jgi:drug/metabolite transporter (DMT)-like permease
MSAISTSEGRSRGSSLDTSTFVAVVVTVIAWASAFPAIRAGLKAFGPVELGALRFAVAALPAALFLVIARPALPSWSEASRFATGGLLFVALYTTLLNIGERTVPAGPASFIINFNPIITAILAMALLGERFGVWAWAGTALSFTGIGLIAFGGEGLALDPGALLVLGSAFCTAITTVVQKPLFKRHGALTVSASNMVIGALILSPFLPSAFVEARTASTDAFSAVIYLGIVPSLIAYATWSIVLARWPASRTANIQYCVPPVATLLGLLWLGETPTPIAFAGGVLALAGVAIVNLKR